MNANDMQESEATNEGMPAAPAAMRDGPCPVCKGEKCTCKKANSKPGSTSFGGSEMSDTDTDVNAALHKAIPQDMSFRDGLDVLVKRGRQVAQETLKARPRLALGGAFVLGLAAVALVLGD